MKWIYQIEWGDPPQNKVPHADCWNFLNRTLDIETAADAARVVARLSAFRSTVHQATTLTVWVAEYRSGNLYANKRPKVVHRLTVIIHPEEALVQP